MSASVTTVLRRLETGEIAPPPAAAWASSAPQVVSEPSTRGDKDDLQYIGASAFPEDAYVFPSLVRPPGAKAYGSDFAAEHRNPQT